MTYDVAVIGGGPAGYSAAIKCAQGGAKVILFEGTHVGGTCLNVGCIPTKCFVTYAEMMKSIRRATGKRIFRDAGMFSYKKIFTEKQDVVKRLTRGVSGLLRTAGVETVLGEAKCVDSHTICCEGKDYSAKKLILATGSRNALPPIPGVNGRNVLDSTGLLALEKMPKSMVIIGAGVIGLEFAGALSSFGCRITAIDMLDTLLPNEDQDAAKKIRQALETAGVRFVFDAKATAIEDNGTLKRVRYATDGKESSCEGEYVLVGAGRAPVNQVAKDLNLDLDEKGFVRVDGQMRTSIEDVYAAGDIVGGVLLAHTAYEEAEIAAENCMGASKSANLSLIPRCIFTIPTYAAVGLTEQEAKKDHDINVGIFPFAASGKAMANGDETGFVKVITDKSTGKILGCCILGHEAAELISIAVVAIATDCTVAQVERMMFPHPTLSESFKEAVLDAECKSVHLPMKKE